jgi:hypothetical protein
MDQMKQRKKSESLLKQLGKPLADFVADFQEHGADTMKKVREDNPTKYLELATKLLPFVVALSPEAPSRLSDGQSMADIGTRLLQSVGIAEPSEAQVEAAILANDEFIAALEGIKARAEGDLN